MTSVIERRQRLDLDSTWDVVKWDEADEFDGSMDQALHNLPADGVKAADVVGVRSQPRQPRVVLVAELKDFAHPNVPLVHQQRVALQATSGELMRDVVRKVIDTLCGATFAHDASAVRCAELDAWRRALGRSSTSLLILLCIEVPATQALAVLPWTKELQRRLRWLGPKARVIVTSSARPFRGDGVVYAVT
jgi:hypothetical protein